jgi:pimeloyl-ACP methyl ester carboxylesterase
VNWRQFRRRQRVATIATRFVSYVDEGNSDNPPVIFLHGIPTWGFLFHQLLERLKDTHRVLVPDLPGFGFSDKSDRFDRSITRQTEMIGQWMDHLKISSAAIVGHDIGGGIALRLATLFRDRVTRLCVINSVAYDSWPTGAMLQFGHPSSRKRLAASTTLSLLRLTLKKGFAAAPDAQLLEGLLAPYRTEVGKLSLIRNASALNTNLTIEITGLLPTITVPVLILWGEHDRFQPLKYAGWLARDIPHARFVGVPEARHFVMFDQPEVVLREIRAFLDDQPPPAETGESEPLNRLRAYFQSAKADR